MLKPLLAATLASVALASPAAALTVLFGGAPTTVSSVTRTVDGVAFTATAARFTAAPSTLTSLSQLLSPLQLSVTAPGIGVAGGASDPQLDTNNPARREAIVLTASRPFEVSGLRLSMVDSNDTLMLYGIGEGGLLTPLVNSGTIRAGLGGVATVLNSGANGGTSRLSFLDPWGNFEGYVLTTRVGGEVSFNGDKGQGYRLDSISVGIIPEPRTWAMLIAGFGLVGVAARRNRFTRTNS